MWGKKADHGLGPYLKKGMLIIFIPSSLLALTLIWIRKMTRKHQKVNPQDLMPCEESFLSEILLVF